MKIRHILLVLILLFLVGCKEVDYTNEKVLEVTKAYQDNSGEYTIIEVNETSKDNDKVYSKIFTVDKNSELIKGSKLLVNTIGELNPVDVSIGELDVQLYIIEEYTILN